MIRPPSWAVIKGRDRPTYWKGSDGMTDLQKRVYMQKKRITRELEHLLRKTDAHHGITLEYQVWDNGEEIVEITYADGWKRNANVTADSDVALIRDVMKAVGY